MKSYFSRILLCTLLTISVFSEVQSKSRNHVNQEVNYQPEQIHLSCGENCNEIIVTWSTMNEIPKAIVKYGLQLPVTFVEGTSTLFVDNGTDQRSQYIHRVKLNKLLPGKVYVYRCGSELGWSGEFWFRTINETDGESIRVALFGDLGYKNARSLPYLQKETQDGFYDILIHVGDLAYDMDDDNGRVGDAFMRQIEPIAAYAPYMVCPGNHEEAYNFSHFKERFSMPGPFENMFYSFNMGPIHFISLNTEAYYYIKYGIKMLVNQYEWLINDLKEANLPENRDKRPWIVTYGHRPMYCSNVGKADCTTNTTRIRIGTPFFEWFGLEDLFYSNGVDLHFWGHEHSYERLWPLYNYEVLNGSVNEPYRNPKGPIHITTGSAGCKEGLYNFTTVINPWSAFRNTDYGYSRLQFFNFTHVKIEQVSVNLDGEVIDSFWIIKDIHGKYT